MAVVIPVAFSYIALTSYLGFGIPCLFHLLTGLECPSCGATRMCQALLRGDIQSAFQYNGCLLVLSPIILGLMMRFVIQWIQTGKLKAGTTEKNFLYVLIGILVIWGVVRNLI